MKIARLNTTGNSLHSLIFVCSEAVIHDYDCVQFDFPYCLVCVYAYGYNSGEQSSKVAINLI